MTTVQPVASTSNAAAAATNDPAVGARMAKELLQRVVRSFYEPRQTIVMDQLVKKEALRDDELAGKVAMPTKDVAKAMARLVEDKLVSVHRRSEMATTFAQKAGQRVYYFIDYKHALDVIKWRMYKMQQTVDTKLRNELDQQGYVCPKCKKKFTPLDASNLFDPSRNVLACDVCDTEVVNNENEREIQGNKDRMQRLIKQTERIRQLLKRLEQLPLPNFDVAQYLEQHGPAGSKAAQQQQLAQGGGGTQHPNRQGKPLSSAQSQSQQPAVKIELADAASSADDVAAAAERARRLAQEAEEKRQQNALPEWIARSTISGEQTSAQRELEAKAATERQEALQGAADSSIGSPTKGKTGAAADGAEDDLDAYYARLAAEERSKVGQEDATVDEDEEEEEEQLDDGDALFESTSAGTSPLMSSSAAPSPAAAATTNATAGFVQTKSGLSTQVHTPAATSVEMDKTGSVDSLESLSNVVASDLANGVKKRSRSNSPDGTDDESAKSKKARVAEAEPAAEPEGQEDEGEDDDDDLFDKEELQDTNPLIQIGEKLVPFDQVDDDMTQAMTPAEYEKYWDVYQRLAS